MLSRSRSWGFGAPQPVPVSEMAVALNEYGIEGEDRREWIYLLQELDAEWLTHTTDKLNADAAARKERR